MCSATVVSYTFSTWTGRGGLYLEDLFVTESMRGQGVGKALFGYLGKLCKDLELPRMDWVVLDWNTPAQDVYRRMGANHVSHVVLFIFYKVSFIRHHRRSLFQPLPFTFARRLVADYLSILDV